MCRLSIIAVLLLGLFAYSAAAQMKAKDVLVWQMGEFDQTSREFGHNFDLESETLKPIFTVGQSKNADWPAWQTTWVNGAAGKRPTPYTILFSLPKPPSGVYRLTISVFLVNPSVPDLMIEVNGHKGRFYFDRKISYYPGDDRIDSPIYGGDTLEIDLPAKFFKARENKLVLTAVEDADNPDTRASLIYDALKLTQCPSRRVQPSAVVKPSVFFRQKENQTYEVTRVTVTVADKLRPSSVDLSIGGKHFRASAGGRKRLWTGAN